MAEALGRPVLDRDAAWRADLFAEQARLALQVERRVLRRVGDQLNQPAAAPGKRPLLIRVQPGELWSGEVTQRQNQTLQVAVAGVPLGSFSPRRDRTPYPSPASLTPRCSLLSRV